MTTPPDWKPRDPDRLRVAVVGAGSWGTAFARHLALHGADTVLLGRRPEQVETIRRTRRNPDYLRQIELPTDLDAALLDTHPLDDVDLLVLSVPSRAFAATVVELRDRVPAGVGVLSLTKGLDPTTLRRMTEVIRDEWPRAVAVAALAGPNHAEEVSRDLPTATVIASADETFATDLQHLVSRGMLRAYVSADVLGVEIASAVKNVIALAAGACDGLSLGDNSRSALIARGLAEMTRLGLHMGAEASTFAGLAGVGDLIGTATSHHSRNWRAGYLIAQGTPPDKVEQALAPDPGETAPTDLREGHTAEGLTAAPAVQRLARRHQAEMPITDVVVAVLRGELDMLHGVRGLMEREPKPEWWL